MNEISVIVNCTLGALADNLDEVKAHVSQLCDDYTSMIITEDNLKDGDDALKIIRAAKKQIDDQRKEIKASWNSPYLEWEKSVKEITQICDNAVTTIKGKMDEYEKQRLEKKREDIADVLTAIRAEFTEETSRYISEDYLYRISTGQKTGVKILIDKWLLKGSSINKIKEEIRDIFSSTEIALSSIHEMHSKYESDMLRTYGQTHNLNEAYQTMRNLEEQERRILEQERIRQEALEQERIRQEERRKALEEQERIEEERRRAEEERRRQEEERRRQEELLRMEREKKAAEERERRMAEELERLRQEAEAKKNELPEEEESFDTFETAETSESAGSEEAFETAADTFETADDLFEVEELLTESERMLVVIVFQTYYEFEVKAIAEADQTAKSLFEKLGII